MLKDLKSFATNITWVSLPACSSITRNVRKIRVVSQAGGSEVPGIPEAAWVLWVRQSPICLVNSETPVEQLPHAGNTQPYIIHCHGELQVGAPLLDLQCPTPHSASCRNCTRALCKGVLAASVGS